MTIQTIKGVYDLCNDVFGGSNNPYEVLTAFPYIRDWIDENAPHTDWHDRIQAIFNTYAGNTELNEEVVKDCTYLVHELDGVLDDVLHLEADEASGEEISDVVIDDLLHIFA